MKKLLSIGGHTLDHCFRHAAERRAYVRSEIGASAVQRRRTGQAVASELSSLAWRPQLAVVPVLRLLLPTPLLWLPVDLPALLSGVSLHLSF